MTAARSSYGVPTTTSGMGRHPSVIDAMVKTAPADGHRAGVREYFGK